MSILILELIGLLCMLITIIIIIIIIKITIIIIIIIIIIIKQNLQLAKELHKPIIKKF